MELNDVKRHELKYPRVVNGKIVVSAKVLIDDFKFIKDNNINVSLLVKTVINELREKEAAKQKAQPTIEVPKV